MRDLQTYYQECREMLDVINVPYGNIKEVVANGKANSRWGCCRPYGATGFIIEINPALLREDVSETALYNTIFHEMLHTIDFRDGHGRVWKKWADYVNHQYDLNIQRCDGDKGEAEKNALKSRRIIKYVVGCPKCGKTWGYQRKSQVVQYPENYRCGKCGSALELVQG